MRRQFLIIAFVGLFAYGIWWVFHARGIETAIVTLGGFVGYFVITELLKNWAAENGGNPPYSKRELTVLKKQTLDDLYNLERFDMRFDMHHDAPKSLTPDGQERYGAGPRDLQFFDAICGFGNFINAHREFCAFQIQELNETYMGSPLALDAPAYGRKYQIYYRHCPVGKLQITTFPSMKETFHEDSRISWSVQINMVPVRFLSFSELSGFLELVAGALTSEDHPFFEIPDYHGPSERDDAMSEINRKMAQLIWDDYDPVGFGPELELTINGTPNLLRINAANFDNSACCNS